MPLHPSGIVPSGIFSMLLHPSGIVPSAYAAVSHSALDTDFHFYSAKKEDLDTEQDF